MFTLGDDYCCRTLTPVTQRSPTPHPARHNPKFNSIFTAQGPNSQRSHLGFTHTGAVVQAAARAAPEQLLPLFVSPDPTGRARLGRRPPADSVRGPLFCCCSYRRTQDGDRAMCSWVSTVRVLDANPLKHQLTNCSQNISMLSKHEIQPSTKTQITIALCN